MDESEFTLLAENLFESLDQALENCAADLDVEASSGLLTITCEGTGTQIVVSRQPAMAQIWMAAKSGGFHFNYDGGVWRCSTTAQTLQDMLSEALSRQCQADVRVHF